MKQLYRQISNLWRRPCVLRLERLAGHSIAQVVEGMGRCVAPGELQEGFNGKQGDRENVGAARGQVGNGEAFMQRKRSEFGAQGGKGLQFQPGGDFVDGLVVAGGEDRSGDGGGSAGHKDRPVGGLKIKCGKGEGAVDVFADLRLSIGCQRGIAILQECLAQAYRPQLEGDRLLDCIVCKTNQFEASAAEVHLQKVVEVLQLRVTSESASNVAGFLLAAEDLYDMTGLVLDAVDEIHAVVGIAYCAGCNDLNGNRVKFFCKTQEFFDTGTTGVHGAVGEFGFGVADAGTDTGLDGFGEAGLDGGMGERRSGNEEFDGIASNIDDGDCFIVNHRIEMWDVLCSCNAYVGRAKVMGVLR